MFKHITKHHKQISSKIIHWYDNNGRDLPWRSKGNQKPDPYKVWVSEIMLQQTTVNTVIPYFEKFISFCTNRSKTTCGRYSSSFGNFKRSFGFIFTIIFFNNFSSRNYSWRFSNPSRSSCSRSIWCFSFVLFLQNIKMEKF